MSKKEQANTNEKKHWLKDENRQPYILTAGLVFLATLFASGYYWYTLRQSVRNDLVKVFNVDVSDTEVAINNRLSTYEDILLGGVGLFNASENVSESEWRSFIKGYDVQNRYPGVRGFSYAAYVSPDRLDVFLEQARLSNPGFKITPAGSRDDYAPVIYSELFANQSSNGLGFDILSETSRRIAAESAAQTGNATLSSRLVLLQDAQAGRSDPGFALYAPIYNKGAALETPEQRRAALRGFVFASFRANDLLDDVFSKAQDKNFALKIYDQESTNDDDLIYKSPEFDDLKKSAAVTKLARYRLHNHTWTIEYAGTWGLIPSQERDLPANTARRSIISCLIIAGLTYYLLSQRGKQLRIQQQREVENAKDDLLSLASHQLRTPATVVKQYVGMLLGGYGGDIDEQQRSMLQKAYDSNERQLQIINQILYVARMDAGQMKLHKSKLDLQKLIQRLISEHDASLVERGQSIKLKTAKKPLLIRADEQYMYMVFDNLLSNASKYTNDGGEIVVKLSKKDKRAVITITDTGVGIHKDAIPQMFEKFTRIDNDRSKQVGGSGIGLYLAKQIVTLHGGEIVVKSEPNKGSTFTITLPYA